MTNPNWKPQPGKPAMTRDEKTLVTDLAYDPRHTYFPFSSKALDCSWGYTGRLMFSDRNHDGDLIDLIEPTAAILAAHGIDADGKPVVDAPSPPVSAADIARMHAHHALWAGLLPPGWGPETGNFGIALANRIAKAIEANAKCGEPSAPAPAPSTRVDDRWFQAAKDFTSALIIADAVNSHDASGYAAQITEASFYADALMAEVAKREGR